MGFVADAASWTGRQVGDAASWTGDVIGTVTGSKQQADAAQAAAATQAAAANAGIAENRRQFDKNIELMAPYVQAGNLSITQQMDMMGLNGPEKQAAIMAEIESSPQYAAMVKHGETAMLQNAAATGGLRGGDLQGALAQFRPQTLANLFQQRLGNLSGITQIGQASAAGQAAQGMENAGNIANLMGQAGGATAGGQIAAGNQWGKTFDTISGLVGGLAAASASGGLSSMFGGGGGVAGKPVKVV